jgi:hypothetical protein
MDDTDKGATGKIEFDNTIVAIWAKAVDTQMHFNEMSVKSRQLGLTFVAAALGLAIFLFSRSASEARFAFPAVIHGHRFDFHVAEFIILAAAAAVYAVKLLDLGVYHKMLRGAVAFGEDLEEVHIRRILGLNKGMTQAISHFSRHSDAKTSVSEGKTIYSGMDRKNAGQKINRFYWVVILSLVACAILMFLIGNDLL